MDKTVGILGGSGSMFPMFDEKRKLTKDLCHSRFSDYGEDLSDLT